MTVMVIGVIAAGSGQLVSFVNTSKTSLDNTRTAESISQILFNTLNSSQAWERTVFDGANSSLACLRLPPTTRDCRGAGGPFRLSHANGSLAYDPATQGFDHEGQICSAPGTETCPYRFDLRWEAVCPPSGLCKNPQVRLIGQLVRFVPSGVEKGRLNTDKYSFNFIQGREANSLRGHCESLNGVYDETTYECELPLEGECPARQVVVKIDRNMTKTCRPILVANCGADQVLRDRKSTRLNSSH